MKHNVGRLVTNRVNVMLRLATLVLILIVASQRNTIAAAFSSSSSLLLLIGRNNHIVKVKWSGQAHDVVSSLFSKGPYGNKDKDDVNEEETTMTELNIHELAKLPKGKPDGFRVINHYSIPSTGFANPVLSGLFKQDDILRLNLNSNNMTLPSALMLLNSESYPTLGHALKACRKGSILVHRGPLSTDETTGKESSASSVFEPSKCFRGHVSDRIFPTDVVAEQVEIGECLYNAEQPPRLLPFELPVEFEDDHFAIVNKPAGLEVHAHNPKGTVVESDVSLRSILPFVLQPPCNGTTGAMRRPQAVHRLDKPTSGLIVVAKTKTAMADLSRQFAERVVKKTYTAICNGSPLEDKNASLSALEASQLGVDVGIGDDDLSSSWNLIDYPLDNKRAITVWRTLRQVKCVKAKDNTLSLIELKPKTGRYRQLRRHAARVLECPLVGDKVHDGGAKYAVFFRKHGLFLCSNRVSIEHPYYNTEIGRAQWNALEADDELKKGIQLSSDGTNRVIVQVEIDLPEKFGRAIY